MGISLNPKPQILNPKLPKPLVLSPESQAARAAHRNYPPEGDVGAAAGRGCGRGAASVEYRGLGLRV